MATLQYHILLCTNVFTNFNVSDESCMNPTLLEIIALAQQNEIVALCVTFNQSLWIESARIVEANGLKTESTWWLFDPHKLDCELRDVCRRPWSKVSIENRVQNKYCNIFSTTPIAKGLRTYFLAGAISTIKLVSSFFKKKKKRKILL